MIFLFVLCSGSFFVRLSLVMAGKETVCSSCLFSMTKLVDVHATVVSAFDFKALFGMWLPCPVPALSSQLLPPCFLVSAKHQLQEGPWFAHTMSFLCRPLLALLGYKDASQRPPFSNARWPFEREREKEREREAERGKEREREREKERERESTWKSTWKSFLEEMAK